MANKVLLKKSSTVAKVPATSDLDYGEIALNYADGKLYFKNSTNVVQPLGIAYTKVIANTTAKINQGYIANTAAGSFTITLPSSPQTGNYVIIVDDASFETNNLYVDGGAEPIVGVYEDLTLNIAGVSVTLLYDGGQWNVYTQVGATGGTGAGTEETIHNYNSFSSSLVPSLNNTYKLGNTSYGWISLYYGDGTVQSTASNADGSSITNTSGTITAQAGGLNGNTLSSGVIYSNLTTLGSQVEPIQWTTSGVNSPTFTSSSVGTKLILYPAIASNQADYAIGIDSATIWNSVPVNSTDFYFKWYGGTTNVATLNGAGALTLAGTLTISSNKVLTLGGSFTTSGAHATTLTTTGTTGVTLPTTGTLATLAGSETFTNKTLTSPAVTTSLTTGSTTFALVNTTATTVNFAGAATTLSIGAATGTATINNAEVVITGNLTVNGTTTTVNSTTVTVDDKNIELGSVASPSNTTADGGGITLKGATDKTLNWVNATAAWTSSEDFNLLTGKVYEINGTTVLSSTTLGSGVTSSSLTTVGTIGTGVWQGTLVAGQYGGTGVNNSGKTITIGGNFTHTGAHTLGLTTSANTSVTLPTTGTLATLAGSETFTNKTLTSPVISTITNTGTLTLPTSTDTLVGRATTDTLTNKTLTTPVIANIKMGYTTTATAAGTTTLTVSSNYRQLFTGSTTQTIVLPVTSTLVTGMSFEIENVSTGNLTVNSSGGNLVVTVLPGTCAHVLCIGTAATTAADWDADFISFSAVTGTGSNVLATSPTLVTPVLGTPSSGTLTSCTGLPISTGVSGLGTGVATALAVNTGSAGAVVLLNGALGTPSSGTLTNATGLPVSGITASTSTALGVGSIELGHATDTTLSRSSAGVLAVEGVVVPTVSSTSTLTNKTLTSPTINAGALSGTFSGDHTLSGNVNITGALTLPNRPAFRVIGNGGAISATTTVTSSHWTLDYQQGSALNTTTGIFTAPVAGLYQVNLVIRTNSNASGTITQAIVRKTAIADSSVTSQIMVEYAANTTMNHAGGSTITKMAVGDTLKLDVTVGTISFDGNDNWSVAYIG
jgi:hypothetical protein